MEKNSATDIPFGGYLGPIQATNFSANKSATKTQAKSKNYFFRKNTTNNPCKK
jgi:hypothetical protein